MAAVEGTGEPVVAATSSLPPEEDGGPNRAVQRAVLPHLMVQVAPADQPPEELQGRATAGPLRQMEGSTTSAGSSSGPVAVTIIGQAGSTAGNDALAGTIVDGSEVVVGVPVEDNGTGKIVKRVIILSTIGASFYICNFNVNLMRGNYNSQGSQDATSLWAAMSSLLIELSIPACGYCGALYNNRQLTCCFCSCNLFIAIVSIMSFIRLNIRMGELDGNCEREQNAQQRRTCEVWAGNGAEKYVMLTSTVLIVCTGCLAFWFGNNLYNRLSQDASSTPPPTPLVGEVISLNPAAPGTAGEVTARGAPAVAGAAAAQAAPGADAAPGSSAAPPGAGAEAAGRGPTAASPGGVGAGGPAPDGQAAAEGTVSGNAATLPGRLSWRGLASTPRPQPAPGDAPVAASGTVVERH